MKYKSKPVVIEAFQFLVDEMPNWFLDVDRESVLYDCRSCKIKTLEGEMTAKHGDWIIKGTEGEFYPCKDSVFKTKYELVEE